MKSRKVGRRELNMENSNWNWLEEFAKRDDDICKRVMADFEDMPSYKNTYKAVLGFLPKPFEMKAKNVPIARLMKLYSERGSGRKQEARRQLQDRFSGLDYPVQKKILTLFLSGSKADRRFCYDKLLDTWDKVFDAKIIELWEKHHEPQCATVLLRHGDMDYIRNHQEELAKASYFRVCRRLIVEDRNFSIDKSLLSPSQYAHLLYLGKRTIDRQEATEILWTAILNAVENGICGWCLFAPYFMAHEARVDEEGRPLGNIVPSIVWAYTVTNCVRYLYYVAPKDVLAEAMHWDMTVGKMFYSLVGSCQYSDKFEDMNAFLKLAYVMWPKDKMVFMENSRTLINELAEDKEHIEESTKKLREAAREYHLTEYMTQEEWKSLYKQVTMAKMEQLGGLVEQLKLEVVCPERSEFIRELLYRGNII